jgi:hypothetical protein
MAEDRFDRIYSNFTQSEDWIKKGFNHVTQGWLSLSSCPLYPKDFFCTPPDLVRIYDKIKVPDAFYNERYFPNSEYGDAEIVQDGVIVQNAISSNYFFHALINCYGLYFYKQNLIRERSEKYPEVIYKTEILNRLNEFLSSAEKWYNFIGYWGALEFRMYLQGINTCPLYLGQSDWYSGESVRFSLDEKISYNDIVTTNSLFEHRYHYIHRIFSKILWAFGIDADEDEIFNFFKSKK